MVNNKKKRGTKLKFLCFIKGKLMQKNLENGNFSIYNLAKLKRGLKLINFYGLYF